MSTTVKIASDAFLDKKSEIDTLDPVIEVNESVSDGIFDRPYEEGEYEEISPRIFSLKDVTDPLTLESLNNAIYELGVVNLCWPKISEPVFETRTSFPKSYYTNSTKEMLLLAYAENFRRQYNFHYKFKVRKPLLLQVPNECGLQKMVCTSIRPTKLCFASTLTWQGLAELVSDYFDYEPLTKPMLHLLGTDYLCHACWELINQNTEQLPVAQGHHNVCTACGRSILRVRSRLILRAEMSEREALIQQIVAEWIQPRELQPTDEVCIPCWLRAQRAAVNRQQQNQIEVQAGPSDNPPELPAPPVAEVQRQIETQQTNNGANNIIALPTIRRAAATAGRCLFPECDDREKLHVPESIRRRVLVDYNFYIPVNARICQYHLGSNLYSDLYTAENSLTTFTANYIEDMVFLLREIKQFDFSRPENMDDHLFKYWFGRTKREYSDIIAQAPRLNHFKTKLGFNALLCKMRTGDSDERISALFQIPRRTLEGYIDQARQILVQDYVPQHLGFNHLSREEFVLRNSYLANDLFGNPEDLIENKNLIVIADGTYLNTQKSSNYLFQKQTYSLHKFHNLVKPFLIVCCDGYIINASGPYAATKNDATIMKELIENDSFSSLFREDDIFILDRGFRDCKDDLYQKGFQVHMPESTEPGQRQLTTLQANVSRCVTMNRWVVEGVNGRFSRDFKIFRTDFLNKRCPHIMEEFSIAAAFLNHFGVQYTERENVETILDIIQEKMFLDNRLAEIVQENNFNMRHTMFQNIDSTNIVFPELNEEDLKLIALGTYQIRQAKSYVGEHMRARGMYTVEVARSEINAEILTTYGGVDPYILRARIKSRHVGSRSYFNYIVVDRGVQGREAILGYYCYCAAGSRTVGCCSHIMSILWYMGYARHQAHFEAPASFLDNLLVT